MELWIRSQDRETIIKTNIIETNKYDDGYGIISYMDVSHTYGLGLYKTKERALEVLDEIQDILIDYEKMSRVVYQMPEE